MFIITKEKYHEGSKKATAMLVYGSLIKVISYLYAAIIAILFLDSLFTGEITMISKIIEIIIEVFVGIAIYITGRIVKAYSSVYAEKQIELKIMKSYEFTKAITRSKPQLKKRAMELNNQYKEYVLSGREEIDNLSSEEVSANKEIIIYGALGLMVIICICIFIAMKLNK